jgi:hypothetical protein
MTPRICIECDHRWTGDLACPECGSPGEPLPLDWPAIVFPSGDVADRVSRSKYRKGQMPSGRKMLEWAKAHDLCFTIDADGLQCERLGQ